MIDQEWVQHQPGPGPRQARVPGLLNWKVAWDATQGEPLDPAAASTIKVFGTEFYLEAFRLLWRSSARRRRCRSARPRPCSRAGSRRALRSMHILTFGGGTNEMQRDLIAIFGLDMPGSPR